MYKIDHACSAKDINFLNSAKNERTLRLRVKKVTSINSVESYIENKFPHIEVSCGFCGSLRRFTSYSHQIIDDHIFITNIEIEKKLFICSRTDTELTRTCRSKELNPNSKELIKTAYGFKTIEAANEFLLKRNKSPFYRTNHESEEKYIKAQTRDAEFYGEEKYIEICAKLSKSLSRESMIERHGIAKFKEICKLKDSSSKKHFQEKYGENWEERFVAKGKATCNNLAAYVKKHGDFVGEIKYWQHVEKCISSRYKHLDTTTKAQRSILYDSSSKNYFKRQYGDSWERHYLEKLKKSCVGVSRASRESLKFYEKLIDKISYLNLSYHLGVGGNAEWYIYDSEEKRFNLYDFCIKELKLIIEFHGSLWHFNPDFVYNRELPFGMTLENNKLQDSYKRALAVKHGFDYYVVFDTDDYEQQASNLSRIIIDKEMVDRSAKL